MQTYSVMTSLKMLPVLMLLSSSLASCQINKMLRYREEHSASFMLRPSWCTLSHFSGENLLMANQPLLRN